MRKWLPLLTICLGTFMLLIDVTIVNVALPDMADDLRTTFGSLQWVVDAYALALAALVLGTGSIADLIGHRRAYLGGLGLFAVSSLACGLAPDPGMLITARTVQGIGAAAMFATTFALLNSSYQGRDRGTAYGIWGAVSGAAAAVGPIIGGVLTELVSWRWIFFVNLPISVAAIALCLLVLPDVPGTAAAGARRVDLAGMATFTAAAGSVTYALIRANDHGWSSVGTWGLLIVSAVLLVVFVLVERHSAAPMLDLALLRNRAFVGILIGALLLTFSAFTYLTYTSIWLQSVMGLSPIQAGLTGLPLSAAAMGVSAGIGRFLHKSRPGPIIGGGVILIGLGGLANMLLVRGSASWPALVPGLILVGIGVGLATPTLSSSAMGAVPMQRGGMAAGAVNTSRQLGYAFGIALLGTVFSARAHTELSGRGVPNSSAVARGLSGGQAPGILHATPAAGRGALSDALHAAAVSGLQGTFLVAGVAGVLAGLVVLLLVRPVAPAQQPAAETAAATPGAEPVSA